MKEVEGFTRVGTTAFGVLKSSHPAPGVDCELWSGTCDRCKGVVGLARLTATDALPQWVAFEAVRGPQREGEGVGFEIHLCPEGPSHG